MEPMQLLKPSSNKHYNDDIRKNYKDKQLTELHNWSTRNYKTACSLFRD